MLRDVLFWALHVTNIWTLLFFSFSFHFNTRLSFFKFYSHCIGNMKVPYDVEFIEVHILKKILTNSYNHALPFLNTDGEQFVYNTSNTPTCYGIQYLPLKILIRCLSLILKKSYLFLVVITCYSRGKKLYRIVRRMDDLLVF